MTPPDDSMLEVYYTINYADRAAFAALIAGNIALALKDRASFAAAANVMQDAYVAAGFAWRAKTSAAMTQIYFASLDAQRAKDAALLHTAQVYEYALDGNPEILAVHGPRYQSLLKMESLFNAVRTQMNAFAEYLSYEDTDSDEAREIFIEEYETEPPAMPDMEMIEDAWNGFIARYANAFNVPNTLADLAAALGADPSGKILSPEERAWEVANHLAAERGPKGECRYCGESFEKRTESIHKGVCHWCDKDQIEDVLSTMGFNVLAYNPLTGEIVTDPPLDSALDDSSASPSLN